MMYQEFEEKSGYDEFSFEDKGGDQICDNILFNSDDFVSKPIKSVKCTIDENIIQLHHSFGYDCYSKMFNICAADNHTVVYAAGSYINMFNINNGNLSSRKCAGNGGIGHISKNPVLNHLAVGENCSDPLIIVYEWPTFEIISVLKGSAKKQNNWLTYSQNGDYLCSQGGAPDNTLTIWDWRKSEIVLRTKSHTHEVNICRFSSFIPDHLVTAGSGHIKFWKMANTFTGLKLQGQLGRFGKTEISNVIGIFSMPDEKVISGCEWGNILVWDEELIDIQVMRIGRKPCHLAPIIMFLYSEHSMELTSVSMDGTIKFWYYHTVDLADPPENDRVLEMEPSFTIHIQDSIGVAKIMGMCKVNDDPSSYDYFIQDGNGGMWLADIEVAANAKPLKRLAKFHGDLITSLQVSPIGYFIASTSMDGWLHVYDVMNKKLIFMHDFKMPITSLIWLPLKIASSGNIFVIGFQTGILKTVAVPLKDNITEQKFNLTEIQSSKPHTSNIKHLTVDHNAKILVCGSDDCSIFIYKIETEPIKLNPIGMYPLPGKVTFIHWKSSEKWTTLISCDSGHIVEVTIPTSRPLYTKESFLLKLKSRTIKTVSIKSEIYRNQFMLDLECKKRAKIDMKKEKLKTIKEENPGVEINEELYFEDSDEEEEPPEIYIPPIPNPVLFSIYTPSEDTIWVSIDGYDAGYLYEYDFNVSRPINATLIPTKDNIPLTAVKIGTNPLLILMGFADGRIRVTNVKLEDTSDLSDFIEYSIHDNKTGRVKSLCFSQDNHMLYSYGDDGNIFSFMFNCHISDIENCMNSILIFPQSPKLIEENIIKTKEDLKLSLEEKKINKEKRKALNLANKEKDRICCLLQGLKEKFKQILISNKLLPEPLQFSHDFFQFDERINSSLIEEAQSEMDKLHFKLAFNHEKSLLGLKKVKNYFVDKILTTMFEVKAITKDVGVKTILHEVQYNLFSSLVEEFVSRENPKRHLMESKDPNCIRQRKSTVLERLTDNQTQTRKVTETEIFLRNVREIYPSLSKKIQSAIDKFATRINFENNEILKIKSMNNEKPDSTNIEEDAMIDNAWDTIGDFNLKTSPGFKPSDDQIISLEDKFKQYLHVKNEIHELKSNFNEKIVDLRQQKIKLIHDYLQFKFDVNMIQNELNDPNTMTPTEFPEVLIDDSIDPNLIDSFEPIQNMDSIYFVLYPKESKLYSEMSKNDQFHEEPTYLEITMRKMRKEKLKHRHQCLQESMLTKINMFDNHLLMLEKTRKDVKLNITFLELFAITLEEELLILNDFYLLEDDFSYKVYLKTEKQNKKINKILSIRDDIKYYNTMIENKSNKLIDIQHTFDMEVRNNDFAKNLRKIFKKKLKIPKVKSDDDDGESLSSSSSNESDDSYSEFAKNGSGDSLSAMGQLIVYDENVIPEGCDPKLFVLTFELRSQRHELEQSIESTKKQVELSNKSLSIALAELTTIENELKKNVDELEAYRIKKQLKLNDIETTVVLNKSQMTNAKLLENSILIYGNIMQVLTNRVIELKKEKEDIAGTFKNEKLLSKQFRAEINMMKQHLKKYKVAIKDEMIKKFRIESNWHFIDNMEMAIINYMIIQAKFNAGDMKERFAKEEKLLENQIRNQKEILSDLLGAQSIKTITLKVLHEGILQLQQALSIQQKNNKKVQNVSIDNSYANDLTSLKDVYETLSKRKQDICKEIDTLKHRGKMFPPIVKQQSPKINRDHSIGDHFLVTPTAVNEQSEESWTISEEEELYNMEFNVEPKISASSKQSLRLTKQLSHYDSFENVEEIDGENEWGKYYDHDVILPSSVVEDLGKNIFNEKPLNLSNENESIGSSKSLSGDVELNNREQWNETIRKGDN